MTFLETIFLFGFAVLALSLFPYDFLVNRGFRHAGAYRAGQILLGFIMMLAHGASVYGFKKTLLFTGTAFLTGGTFETLGVLRGWIFGGYRYTDKAGPKVFGVLPASIPILWCVVSYMGYSSACLILRGAGHEGAGSRILLAGTASLVVLLLDLVIDPIAVDEGVWVWKNSGLYHGVPLSNFMGWLFTAAVIFTAAVAFSIFPVEAGMRIPWFTYLPAFGYCLFLGICSKVCFERKLTLPGILGILFAMGLFIIQIARIAEIGNG